MGGVWALVICVHIGGERCEIMPFEFYSYQECFRLGIDTLKRVGPEDVKRDGATFRCDKKFQPNLEDVL